MTMKKLGEMAAVLVIFGVAVGLGSACTRSASAARPAAPSWKGTGRMFDLEGGQQGDYVVELTRQSTGQHAFEQRIRVLIPGREPMEFTQTLVEGDHGFRVTSDAGNGGGMDLGDGFITLYTVDKDGMAQASSIIM